MVRHNLGHLVKFLQSPAQRQPLAGARTAPCMRVRRLARPSVRTETDFLWV